MSAYEEFELDPQKIDSDDQAQPQAFSPIISPIATSILTGCTGNCLTVRCNFDGITRSTGCTVNHTRCKG